MKYVVLLTGNNRMAINEFFTYMDIFLKRNSLYKLKLSH